MNIYYIKRKIKVKFFFLQQDLSYLIEDIKSKLSDIFYYYPKRFFKRIQNLIYWFPVIWNDYWWDDYYLMVLIKHKLVDMEKNFREKGNCEGSSQIADEMKSLLKDIDEYFNMDNNSNHFEELNDHYNYKFELLFKRVKSGYRMLDRLKDKKYYDQLRKLEYTYAERKKNKIEKIFKTLSDKRGYWWD